MTYRDIVPAGPCTRTAWLSLSGLPDVPLEDESSGYFCSELTLGSPTVREVISNRPDQDGADDRTAYLGPRTVSAKLTAIRTAGAVIDAVATMFGPYLQPSARPTLHYVLERGDNPERVLTLRGSAYEWSVIGADGRDVHLQWTAADPVAYDPATYSATAWAGTSTAGGRSYDRTYDRTYAPGGMSSTTGQIIGKGDLPVRPVVDIFGPITDPLVRFSDTAGDSWVIAFAAGYRIDATNYVTVDTAAHSAYANGDPTASVLASLDWTRLVWPVLPPRVAVSFILGGTNTTQASQVAASWRDGYYG
jgi:hypothetical protein